METAYTFPLSTLEYPIEIPSRIYGDENAWSRMLGSSLNLDTFKDIWRQTLPMPGQILSLPFRYLQGYMETKF